MTMPNFSKRSLQMIRSVPAFADVDVESAAFLETVLNASQDCIKVLTLAGDLVFMNSGGQSVMEISDFQAVSGRPWLSFWDNEYFEAATRALDTARAGGTGHFIACANTMRQNRKWWDVTVTPIFGSASTPSHILSIARDITLAKQLEEQRELLTSELEHRVKNVLAVVSAIASQSFHSGNPDHLDAFRGRVAALGEAQGLLVQTAWQSASMGDVVAKALLPHMPPGRGTYDGPAFELTAKRGLALALAVHELATNAIKYGAFANDTGRVDVQWTVKEGQLVWTWSERDGPPVEPSDHKGFGSRVITRNLASEFKGKVDLQHRTSGVVLILTATA